MFIGVACTIPDLPNLPGQGGESITVTLDYPSSNVCYDGTTSPSDASPAGGIFSYTGSGTLDLNTSNGDIDANNSDPGSYTVIYTKSGVSSNFPIVIGNDITLSITPVPGATICTGDTATLTANASGGSGSFTYSWNTSATTQAISVTTSGTYTVTVTDSNGCTATASQAITASTNATAIASINNDAAMSFNGTDQYLSAEHDSSLNLTTELTVSMWVNISGGTSYRGLFTKGSINPPGYGSYSASIINNSNNKIRFYLGSSNSVAVNLETTTGLSNNTWHHLAFVYNGSQGFAKVYIDGSQVSTTSPTIPSSIYSNTEDFYIGAYYNNSLLFNGKMDEVAIWDSALSSCDIEGIYDATTTVNGQPKSANLLDANTTIPAPVYWNRMGDS